MLPPKVLTKSTSSICIPAASHTLVFLNQLKSSQLPGRQQPHACAIVALHSSVQFGSLQGLLDLEPRVNGIHFLLSVASIHEEFSQRVREQWSLFWKA